MSPARSAGGAARRGAESTLRRRYREEARFRFYGRAAVLLGLAFVVAVFASIIHNGYTAFAQTSLKLVIAYDPAVIDPQGSRRPEDLEGADYGALIKRALRALDPAIEDRATLRRLYGLLSDSAAAELAARVRADPGLIGRSEEVWLLASDRVDQVVKGHLDRGLPEQARGVSDLELGWIDALTRAGALKLRFNRGFFENGDSRQPEQAGVASAVMGSFYTLLVTICLSFPIGVAAAVYLEEFAPRTRLTDLIEVNINNLAAVPSIVFGLLGLTVFIQFFGLPRSVPLVGGLVLTLMTLPTIIIASRAALKAVPPSIHEAALGMGASKVQSITHHVLPIAMPGMLTGGILGMARALGESAPLLLIGMVAFIVDVPRRLTDPATVLPVQVYLWARSSERAFVERTSGAILVLLAFLLLMNALAVVLRSRFERRW